MLTDYLNVPVEICQYALSEGKEWQVYCYLLLKQDTPGYTYLNNRQMTKLSGYIDRHPRTIKRYLKFLEDIDWIAPKGKVYTIKSWKKVFSLMGFRYISSIEMDVKTIEDPQAFFAGAVLGRLANFQKFKREGSGQDKGAISLECASIRPDLPNYFPIADRAISKILTISKGKANKLKKKAHEHDYIDLKYNYQRYNLNGQPVNIKRSDAGMFRVIFNDIGPKARLDKSNRVFVQNADIMKPNLRYKKGRNFV